MNALWIFVGAWVFFACDNRPKPSSPSPRAPTVPVERPRPKPAVSGDWPLYLGDVAQSGKSADTRLKPPLALAWRYETSGRLSASPIVVGETVYIGSSDRRFFALNASRWGERWRFLAKAPVLQSAAYADGVVVFSDAKANLYGLHAESGTLLWQVSLDGWTVSPPIFAGGAVWVGIHPDRIFGVDPFTGVKIAEFRRTATLGGVEYTSERGYFAPSARFHEAINRPRGGFQTVQANGFLYQAYSDGTLRALSSDGKSAWKTHVEGGIGGAPALARGFLYVPGNDGSLWVYARAADVRRNTASFSTVASVTVWESAARSEPNEKASFVAVLNDRSRYRFLEERNGWAHVLLPNGERAWIPPGDWATLPSTPTEGRFFENRSLVRLSKGVLLPAGAEKPVWSKNGEHVAFFLRTRLSGQFWVAQEIAVWNATTGEAHAVARGSFLNPHLSWSFDSKWIAFETYQNEEAFVWVVGVQGQPLRRLAVGDAPSWSPTAHRLAFRRRVGDSDELWRVDGNGEAAIRLLSLPIRGYVGSFAYLNPAAWSPKGTLLALGADAKYYEDGRARLLTLGIAENAQPTAVQTPAEQFREIEWSPDGVKIACVLGGHLGGSAADPLDERVYVYWMEGSKPPFSVSHTAVTWVDAHTIAYVEWSASSTGRHRIWLHDVERRTRTLLLETTTSVAALEWVPARKALALWTTSEPIRNGKRLPAETRGWLVRLARPS